jgi:heptaprenyl diphosphate synthase
VERLRSEELDSILQPISPDLERIEKLILEASGGEGSFITERATYLALAGGKRLRPALAVLCSRLGRGAGDDVDKAAAAVEMTHLATLYHDDVIDDGDLRHGVQSVNRRWGDHVAILAGDFLFARSSHLASEIGGEIPQILATAVARVVEAQLAELRWSYRADRSVEQYLETIDGKTGALMEASAWIGAILGGCSAEEIEQVRLFGAAFGRVFQVADDLLDLVATKEQLGKPPGTDVRTGVYTLPLLYAVEKDRTVSDLLGEEKVDMQGIRRAVRSTGSLAGSLAFAAQGVDEAVGHLRAVSSSEARDALERLTRLIVDRVPTPEGAD